MRWHDKRLAGETRRELVMVVCATAAFVAAAYATVQAAIYFSEAGYSESASAGGSLVVGVALYNGLYWVARLVVRPPTKP